MKKPFALALAYLLLLGVWSVSNPPGAAPDEVAHYLRAIAAGRGELVLDELPEPLAPALAADPGRRFQHEQTRVVRVPGTLSPEIFNCNRLFTTGHWLCPGAEPPRAGEVALNTWVGTYPPWLYAPPGVAMNLAPESWKALLAGRFVSMLLAWALIAGAVLLLYDRESPWSSELGLMAAITPMAVFVGSSLTPNGPEIAAGACFAAALFRLTRPWGAAQASSLLAWGAAGVSGLVLVAARDLGPAWLVAYGLVLVGLAGLRRPARLARKAAKPAGAALLLLSAGLLAALYWQVGHQVRSDLDLGRLLSFVPDSFATTKEVARQEIGVFGPLLVVLPGWAYVAWSGVLLAIGACALIAGTVRERAVLLLTCVAAVVVPAGIDMVQRLGGFGVQGRHALPFTVVLPLLAGEIVHRHAGELEWLRRLKPSLILAGVTGPVLGYAWYFNSRFYIAGPDRHFPFWEGAGSSPPLGWPALAGVTAAGVALMVVYGYLASRSSVVRHPPASGAGTREPAQPGRSAGTRSPQEVH